MNRRLRTLLRPVVRALLPLASLLARQTLRRGRTAVGLSLARDGWTGRYATRYGRRGEREYLCIGVVPWVRLEVWRDAPDGPEAPAGDTHVTAGPVGRR